MEKQKKQVFVVDDDDLVRNALKRLLNGHGLHVRTFASAEEFFSAIPAKEPGYLILDIHMPGLNGLDALQRVINAGSKHPVIIITGDKNDLMEEHSIKTGAIGFLRKPFSEEKLLALLGEDTNSDGDAIP
ncbi:MAG: response regulator [Candidatus Omnitrophica bacterium]|nr:response regulator [Candidatus Omnitrophota bacterium]